MSNRQTKKAADDGKGFSTTVRQFDDICKGKEDLAGLFPGWNERTFGLERKLAFRLHCGDHVREMFTFNDFDAWARILLCFIACSNTVPEVPEDIRETFRADLNMALAADRHHRDRTVRLLDMWFHVRYVTNGSNASQIDRKSLELLHEKYQRVRKHVTAPVEHALLLGTILFDMDAIRDAEQVLLGPLEELFDSADELEERFNFSSEHMCILMAAANSALLLARCVRISLAKLGRASDDVSLLESRVRLARPALPYGTPVLDLPYRGAELKKVLAEDSKSSAITIVNIFRSKSPLNRGLLSDSNLVIESALLTESVLMLLQELNRTHEAEGCPDPKQMDEARLKAQQYAMEALKHSDPAEWSMKNTRKPHTETEKLLVDLLSTTPLQAYNYFLQVARRYGIECASTAVRPIHRFLKWYRLQVIAWRSYAHSLPDLPPPTEKSLLSANGEFYYKSSADSTARRVPHHLVWTIRESAVASRAGESMGQFQNLFSDLVSVLVQNLEDMYLLTMHLVILQPHSVEDAMAECRPGSSFRVERPNFLHVRSEDWVAVAEMAGYLLDYAQVIWVDPAPPADVCAVCLDVPATLSACARCFKTKYCCTDCQKLDWQVLAHKTFCTPTNGADFGI